MARTYRIVGFFNVHFRYLPFLFIVADRIENGLVVEEVYAEVLVLAGCE